MLSALSTQTPSTIAATGKRYMGGVAEKGTKRAPRDTSLDCPQMPYIYGDPEAQTGEAPRVRQICQLLGWDTPGEVEYRAPMREEQ